MWDFAYFVRNWAFTSNKEASGPTRFHVYLNISKVSYLFGTCTTKGENIGSQVKIIII